MYPALAGDMLRATCASCQSELLLALESYTPENPRRCYHCGGQFKLNGPGKMVASGQKVRLHRLSPHANLERFDVVSFEHESEQYVKRVWGLPGEQLTFQHGELKLNGAWFRKSLSQFERVAITVDEWPSQARSNDKANSSWTVLAKSSSNRKVDRKLERASGRDGIRVDKANLKLAAGESLFWRHLQPSPVHPVEDPEEEWLEPRSLNDDYPCNQGLTYELQPVDDLLLQIEFVNPLTCTIEASFQYGGQEVSVIISHEPATGDDSIQAEKSVVVALCDGRILMRSDMAEKEVASLVSVTADWSWSLDRDRDPTTLLITAQGDVAIAKVCISRDLYLRSATPREVDIEYPKLEGTCFLIGDNLPASSDSRGDLGPVLTEEIRWRIE